MQQNTEQNQGEPCGNTFLSIYQLTPAPAAVKQISVSLNSTMDEEKNCRWLGSNWP